MIGWLYEFLPAFLSLCGITTIFFNLFRHPNDRWDPVVAGDFRARAGGGKSGGGGARYYGRCDRRSLGQQPALLCGLYDLVDGGGMGRLYRGR